MSKISIPCIFPNISRRSRPVAWSRSVGTVPVAAPGGRRSASVWISKSRSRGQPLLPQTAFFTFQSHSTADYHTFEGFHTRICLSWLGFTSSALWCRLGGMAVGGGAWRWLTEEERGCETARSDGLDNSLPRKGNGRASEEHCGLELLSGRCWSQYEASRLRIA